MGVHSAAFAQSNISMPYSIYGVGEVWFNQYFQNLGKGGISQAYRANTSVNDINPASYSAFDATSFVFEATMLGHFYEQETLDASQWSDYITLGNISLGFPVTSWWSAAAGLKPYSQLGYTFSDQQLHPEAGALQMLYEGSGGINQLFVGSAVEPLRGLSFGVNASYLFGNLDREVTVRSDTVGFFETNRIENHRVNGWMLGFGLQYHHRFADNRHITFGATYGPEQMVDVNSSETHRRRQAGQHRFDTIAHFDNEPGELSLPYYYGVGVFGRVNANWAAGIDYQWQNWEAFEFMGRKEDFNDSYLIAAGVQYTPTPEALATMFHRLRYSAGVRYGQSYLNPDGESLNEFGIGFGVSIPVRGSLSALNLNFEYSKRGSTDDHFMEENFYRINIGVNIYERWFIRRRFF